MCNKIIGYVKTLLSDSRNLPSTRLHLAWGCFFLLCYAVGTDKPDATITAIIGGMATMAGLSVIDRSGKNERSNDNNTNGESEDTSSRS